MFVHNIELLIAIENIILDFIQAQATRERPRTGSQNSSSAMPVSVAPPPGQVQTVPQPAPQPKPPSVDLLGDLGGDPFAQPQPQPQGYIFVDFESGFSIRAAKLASYFPRNCHLI